MENENKNWVNDEALRETSGGVKSAVTHWYTCDKCGASGYLTDEQYAQLEGKCPEEKCDGNLQMIY